MIGTLEPWNVSREQSTSPGKSQRNRGVTCTTTTSDWWVGGVHNSRLNVRCSGARPTTTGISSTATHVREQQHHETYLSKSPPPSNTQNPTPNPHNNATSQCQTRALPRPLKTSNRASQRRPNRDNLNQLLRQDNDHHLPRRTARSMGKNPFIQTVIHPN